MTEESRTPTVPPGAGAPDIRTTRNPVAIEIADVHKWFGEFHVLRDIDLKVMRGRAHRHLRAVGLRQVDADALHQPAREAGSAAASSSTAWS